MILCVAGNPSIDKLFEVERVTPGRIHRPLAFVQLAGGKGLNVARAAAALGVEVMAAGLLAGHAGRWVAEALASEGIRVHFVWCAGETRDSLSVADRDTGSLTEFYETGTPVRPDDWRALEAEVRAVLAGVSWITMSGSLLPGAPDGGYANLIRAAGAAGVRSAVDAHGAQLEAAIGASPELVKINRDEAGALLGASVVGRSAAGEAALTLRRQAGGTGHAAAVTLGADGAVLAGPDGSVWQGAVESHGPYPVGSGDAFLAGLAAGLERDEDWPHALALALGAASANAEVPGAGRLDPARARALAGTAEIQPLA